MAQDQRNAGRLPRRRNLLGAGSALAGLAALGILAAGQGAAAQGDVCAGHKGGTMVVTSTQVPRHLNPAVQSGVATAVPGTQIFASPLRFDDDWNAIPYLAEKVDISDDGKTVTIVLRDGVTFHDGKPVTSEDVAFSIQTIKENHPFQTMLAPVESIATPDARTAVLTLSQPHPAIELAMSPALMPILPKHIFGDGQDAKTHPANNAPVGSGPFKLVEFVPAERIVLERNPDFFLDGLPCLDRIVINIVRDSANAVLSLERGEAHMQPFTVNSRDIKRLSEEEHLDVTKKGYAAVGPINWLAFNTRKAPLDNKDVRKAIALAIDRSFITDKLQQGISSPATGPITPDSPFYTAEVELYEKDVDRANAMLDAAGFPKNADDIRFPLTIDYIPGADEQQKNIAEFLKPTLKQIGIDLNVRAAPDFPTWAKRVAGGDFDLSMDIVFNWGDPVIGVHRTYLTDNIKPQIWTNTQGYSNPKVDELLAQAAVELDQDKRKALYREFQQIVVDDIPLYYINLLPYHTVYDKKVGNVPTNIWGTMSPMDEVYLSE
ncbi:ABC transporter substrate-binding protein [Marinibaculum pumilum]|uniref:ABC transporter substrate-binding protein n=1 Tax=Marinibaculum pumilum TaxID=1766165 RepID=A0ABV7LA28_9PROT